jgi:hypothetical protein
MFRWYARAMKCYAFLGDLEIGPGKDLDAALEASGEDAPLGRWDFTRNVHARRPDVVFANSRWWSRGWTLQELIAPYQVEFYNRRWEFLTSKRACKRFITHAFGIPAGILDHSTPLSSVPVAERISWASQRDTTREEDIAYSLLGILDVNMPLLYGEGGARAFQRLQEHSLVVNEDYTLLLWDFLSVSDTVVTPPARGGWMPY